MALKSSMNQRVANEVVPLILLLMAFLFFIFIWLGYAYGINEHVEPRLPSYLPTGLVIGVLAFALAFLGMLFIGSSKGEALQSYGQGSNRMGLALCALAAVAVLLLVLVWWGYHDLSHMGSSSPYVLVTSIAGLLVFSLAYLWFVFTNIIRKRPWHWSIDIGSSFVISLLAVIGSRFWYRSADDPRFQALLLFSSLIFFLPAALAIYLQWREQSGVTTSSTESGPRFTGSIHLSSYIVSLSLYLLMIRFVGPLLGGDHDLYHFDETLFNMVFWFLLPVHSGAVLVYTLACGKGGSSWTAVVARLMLSGLLVFLSYRALEIVDWIYG